jgi:hypothetical protein
VDGIDGPFLGKLAETFLRWRTGSDYATLLCEARPNAINRDIHDAKKHTAVSLLKDARIPEAFQKDIAAFRTPAFA